MYSPVSSIIYFIMLLSITTISQSCIFDSKKEEGFYQTYSDWDIDYIPIIAPYKASSISKGQIWTLSKDTSGSVLFEVEKFGVSENFIYGYASDIKEWFILNTSDKMLSFYPDSSLLSNVLDTFSIKKNPIIDCNDYFNNRSKCYWYPNDLKTYPDYKTQNPHTPISIDIIDKGNYNLHFSVDNSITYNSLHIYYFKIKFNKPISDLYYIHIGSHSLNPSASMQYRFVKDQEIIPVYIPDKNFEITIYVPYPVAEEKGINQEFRKNNLIFKKTYTFIK